jgi:hypothetical protein
MPDTLLISTYSIKISLKVGVFRGYSSSVTAIKLFNDIPLQAYNKYSEVASLRLILRVFVKELGNMTVPYG